VKQNLSTAYHPQTDGQTERVNQVVEGYLRAYIDYAQDDWEAWLPLAEFSYNNSDHSSTGMSPFYANYGFHPRLEVSDFIPSNDAPKAGSAAEYIQELRSSPKEAQEAIVKAISTSKTHYDSKRKDAPEYKEGDMVFVSAENIRTTRPTKKLAERQLGPFPVLKVVSPSACGEAGRSEDSREDSPRLRSQPTGTSKERDNSGAETRFGSAHLFPESP
jgi:hypothetical protein